jgi:hypothetical protein
MDLRYAFWPAEEAVFAREIEEKSSLWLFLKSIQGCS